MRKILAALAICGTFGMVAATAVPAQAARFVVRLGDNDRGRDHGRNWHARRNNVVIINRHRAHNHRHF